MKKNLIIALKAIDLLNNTNCFEVHLITDGTNVSFRYEGEEFKIKDFKTEEELCQKLIEKIREIDFIYH